MRHIEAFIRLAIVAVLVVIGVIAFKAGVAAGG